VTYGIKAYYRFDEGTGSVARNSNAAVGAPLDAALAGPPTWVNTGTPLPVAISGNVAGSVGPAAGVNVIYTTPTPPSLSSLSQIPFGLLAPDFTETSSTINFHAGAASFWPGGAVDRFAGYFASVFTNTRPDRE
jgi:hypothetical protein